MMANVPELEHLQVFASLPESERAWVDDLSPYLNQTALTSQLSAPWTIMKELIKSKILQIVSEEFERTNSDPQQDSRQKRQREETTTGDVTVVTSDVDAETTGLIDQDMSVEQQRNEGESVELKPQENSQLQEKNIDDTTQTSLLPSNDLLNVTTKLSINRALTASPQSISLSPPSAPSPTSTLIFTPSSTIESMPTTTAQTRDEINAQLRVIGDCFDTLNELRVTLTRLAPFTIQRLCELVMFPNGHYRTIPKYLRAVEKVLRVTSIYQEPDLEQLQSSILSSSTPILDVIPPVVAFSTAGSESVNLFGTNDVTESNSPMRTDQPTTTTISPTMNHTAEFISTDVQSNESNGNDTDSLTAETEDNHSSFAKEKWSDKS